MSRVHRPTLFSLKMEKGLLLKRTLLFLSLAVISICCIQCKTDPLSAEASLDNMTVEEGFEVKLIASEPLISAPVALTFDNQSRIWALEMNGFMPDTLGTGEDKPSGKVVILEDEDQDGVMDTRKVFLDSLRLPRALCLIEDGLLVGEPPYLWYYEIKKDKPGKRILVDSSYADEGNVEHQPNGLLRAMDNWIYNAKSAKRYKKDGDRWIIEQTHFRGQWGISQDNYGRLYYNHNSANVIGDYFTPGLGATNKNQREVAGYNMSIVRDNRVYPAHATPGVNRGYLPGVLDTTQRLVNFTAACGPLIYRGNYFPAAYRLNSFVAEPAGNLVKRNLMTLDSGYEAKGVQAYQDKEFISSVDERFRPVNLHDGPDGALYVVDMYRGIIQHKTYLTPYLKQEIKKRNLTLPLVCGRIYKVVPKGKHPEFRKMPEDPQALVRLLADRNGWIRDRAQQILVDRKSKDVVPALKQSLRSNNINARMHAFWTLEGLHALEAAQVLEFLNSRHWPLKMQGLSVIPAVINKKSASAYVKVLTAPAMLDDKLAAPYVAFLAKTIRNFDPGAADLMLNQLVKSYSTDKFVADAVLSNLEGKEEAFQKQVLSQLPDTALIINKQLKTIVTNKFNALNSDDPKETERKFPGGAALFRTNCQTCHGADLNGIKSLAPPLNKSEWVTGKKERLIAIVLYGLTGPVEVNKHLYTKPEIMADMPGIAGSNEFSDEDIAQLLSYIRDYGRNKAESVKQPEVTAVREKFKGRDKAFTVEELLSHPVTK
jgi:mono/diheme cytochrome c family protein/glucose/arabinose dehydrogenase